MAPGETAVVVGLDGAAGPSRHVGRPSAEVEAILQFDVKAALNGLGAVALGNAAKAVVGCIGHVAGKLRSRGGASGKGQQAHEQSLHG